MISKLSKGKEEGRLREERFRSEKLVLRA